MRRRDIVGLCIVTAATAGLVAYRAIYIEPRAWGALCAASAPPLACLPRAGLIWLQRYYLWGTISLGLGLWSFAWRAPFTIQIAAIVIGIAGIENYNATWGAVGAALGAWAWLRDDGKVGSAGLHHRSLEPVAPPMAEPKGPEGP
jgi:hypothetical protein